MQITILSMQIVVLKENLLTVEYSKRKYIFYKALADNQLNWPTPDPIRQDGPNMPYVLVGDSAFALTEKMMKPYPGNHDVGTTRRIFNYRLSRARRIVENVFGILGVVFRIFRTPITILPFNAELVVMACVYLHNFLMRNSQSRSLYNPHGTFDSENVDHDILEGSWRRETGSVNMSNLMLWDDATLNLLRK